MGRLRRSRSRAELTDREVAPAIALLIAGRSRPRVPHCHRLCADQWPPRHARGSGHREDAERFLTDLRERFAQCGLERAEEKTRRLAVGSALRQHSQEKA